MLKNLQDGGVFLLTSEYDKDTVWSHIPGRVQKQIIDKKAKFFVIDAIKIGHEIGLGARINTIMQVAFFKISKVIDESVAIEAIKYAVKKTYGKKGDAVVNMNIAAIDKALAAIEEVTIHQHQPVRLQNSRQYRIQHPSLLKMLQQRS
jgi:pyruvate-ferredoxin/flavodoxin oxidoreductase